MNGKQSCDANEAQTSDTDRGTGGLDPVQFPSLKTYDEFNEALRKRREGRNYKPRTRKEIDEAMREERAGWDHRP